MKPFIGIKKIWYGAVITAALEQKEKWYADECAASETNELPFREVEQHLGFYFG